MKQLGDHDRRLKRGKKRVPYVFSNDLFSSIREIDVDEIIKERHGCYCEEGGGWRVAIVK